MGGPGRRHSEASDMLAKKGSKRNLLAHAEEDDGGGEAEAGDGFAEGEGLGKVGSDKHDRPKVDKVHRALGGLSRQFTRACLVEDDKQIAREEKRKSIDAGKVNKGGGGRGGGGGRKG